MWERNAPGGNFGPFSGHPLEPAIGALAQLSPQSQETVILLVRQLAEREGVTVASAAAPGLQTPAEGMPLWVAKLKGEGYAKRTVHLYRYLAGKYLEGDPAPTKLGVQRYLAERLERVSPALVSNEKKALSSLFGFLHAEGLWPINPMSGIGRVKVRYTQRRCPEEADVLALLGSVCLRSRDTEKLRTLVLLMASTGLRLSETAGILKRDIDLEGRQARVMGKGGKERTVPLLPVTVAAIRVYMEASPNGTPFLFPGGTEEGHCCIHSVEKTFRHACQRLGIERITPHQLRHFFATYTLKNGAKLEVVSRILGHAGVGITCDIYRHVLTSEMHSEVARFGPFNGRLLE